ncbi:MAG: hypothetical protein IT282_09710 [Bacteroidetes bacterium]|nr:hypothetical protein [Bacteroidota bacterium]
MSHSTIITDIYSNFSRYHELWLAKRAETGELGALVFLPGKELECEWWSIEAIREYIRQGGLDDRELIQDLDESSLGEDFLVLVIEYCGGPAKQKASFHRISKANLN